MKVLLTLMVCVFPMLSFAQEPVCSQAWVSQAQDTCSKESLQTEAAQCFITKNKLAEIELKNLYKTLVGDLVEPQPLINSQSAWERFRSNECTYQLSGYSCRTKNDMSSVMCVSEMNACSLPLTCERVRQLRLHIGLHCNGCPVRKSDGK